MHIRTADDLAHWVDDLRHQLNDIQTQIKVCGGAGCRAAGSQKVFDALVRAAQEQKLSTEISFEKCIESKSALLVGTTGCQGLCQSAPLVTANEQLFVHVQPNDATAVLNAALEKEAAPDALFYYDNATDRRISAKAEIPFFNAQTKISLDGCGELFSDSLASYVLWGGFESLVRALEITPEKIIEIIESSGLRGRGGGGFLTGRKWRSCVSAIGDERFIVCNGDEGDPGAFMDCALMEGNPYSIIEGMLIGAKAIGAHRGYIYVRNEYPVAVAHLRNAILQCKKVGLIGDDILGSGFAFELNIVRGGGAFVCGESSALMRSIEGKIGEPNSKYIRSTEQGLFGKPTVLNNVETFACIPKIINHGSEAFASIGTTSSKGTKAFCLAGRVVNTGLVEVPMGTTLRRIIFDIGGGIQNGRTFKAVQTGGPSGGCLPEAKLDMQVDFEQLSDAGSMMGSGGMIVMDDHSCMVDVAKYFTTFLMHESCGKCVPCREGLFQLHTKLSAITKGVATLHTLNEIEYLANEISLSALCGLGKSAPNPVLSAISNFRDEFVTHIKYKRCEAGVCTGLTTFIIDTATCTGCMRCKKVCPVNAIDGEAKAPHVIDASVCIRCGACRQECSDDAVVVA